MIRGPKKTVGVLMPMRLYERLKALSGETDWTLPAYIRQVLRHYLWCLDNDPDAVRNWPTVQKKTPLDS